MKVVLSDARGMSPREKEMLEDALTWQNAVYEDELEEARRMEEDRADRAIRTLTPMIEGLLVLSGAAGCSAWHCLSAGDLGSAVAAAAVALGAFAMSRVSRDWRNFVGEEDAA